MSQPLPSHDPQVLAASLGQARKFYANDSQLTREDREKLASCFRKRMTLYPFLGLPVVAGFIMIPNILKRRGIINTNKRVRLVQVGLGFLGLGVGVRFSGVVATQLQSSSLSDREPALQSYLQLASYPPQLGSRYYTLSAQYPELVFKDPETIDWKQSPLFPLCLVMNKDIIQQFRNAESKRNQAHIERMNGFQRSKSPVPETTGDIPLTGTSWDNVIKQGAQENEDQRNKTQSIITPDNLDQGTIKRPSNPELEDEQRKFDELLDRERNMSNEEDTFSADKKW